MICIREILVTSLAVSIIACNPEPEPSATKQVIGDDDRISVNPGADPWLAFGRLDFAAGGHCSGTLVGADLVLTAAHCVYDEHGHQHGGTTFTPVSDFGNQDFQAEIIDHRVGVVDYQNNWVNDWAVLKLDRRLGDEFGWVGVLGSNSNDIKLPMSVSLAGFSSDVSGGATMSAHLDCQLKERLSTDALKGMLVSDCDTEKGASGSAVVASFNDGFVAVGVHSRRYTYPDGKKGNGVAISGKILEKINELQNL